MSRSTCTVRLRRARSVRLVLRNFVESVPSDLYYATSTNPSRPPCPMRLCQIFSICHVLPDFALVVMIQPFIKSNQQPTGYPWKTSVGNPPIFGPLSNAPAGGLTNAPSGITVGNFPIVGAPVTTAGFASAPIASIPASTRGFSRALIRASTVSWHLVTF